MKGFAIPDCLGDLRNLFATVFFYTPIIPDAAKIYMDKKHKDLIIFNI